MLEVGYPAFERHHEQHRRLLNQLNQIASQAEMKEIDDLEVIDFLVDWFLDHTVQEDVKIAEFMRTKV